MKVYFEKLKNNGDWICYDELNTTGDLFVDPTKIELLTKMLPTPEQRDGVEYYQFSLNVKLEGFGRTCFSGTLTIKNGYIFDMTLGTHGQGVLVYKASNKFFLELPELPAFEPYPYPAQDVEDDAN